MHLQLLTRKVEISRSRTMLGYASLLLAISLSLGIGATAAWSADTDETNLSRLEVKFFQHEYPKDTMDSRLDRLEKMVFGETKTGSQQDRLANLVSAVPNPAPVAEDEPAAPPTEQASSGGSQSAPQAKPKKAAPVQAADDNYTPPDSSKYPAVTAVENRVFGKDYAADPVNKRLERLETKVFGKPSNIDDLSERVDRIKQATGVDIAKQAPRGSDWADDDEDEMDMASGGSPSAGRTVPYTPPPGDDGRSFSGHDLRQDMQQAFGNRGMSGFGGTSGTYGMNAPDPGPRMSRGVPNARSFQSYGGGGSYGAAAPQPSAALPPTAAPAAGMGLSQQVASLEQEIFGRTFKEPLPQRLNRLESTVFPNQKPALDKALPERVDRLKAVVPLSQPGRIAQSKSKSKDPDFEDLDDMDLSADMPQGQGGQPRPGSGLSKIINSMSNFLTGGFIGGYPMGSGNLTQDPTTGLLYDRFSGNLIDPATGVVVGQRSAPSYYGSGTGMGMGSFSNGFSPFGSTMPFGFGSSSSFGFGGSRLGVGGASRMWP
jgi:hypothetical protein